MDGACGCNLILMIREVKTSEQEDKSEEALNVQKM